MHNSLIPLQYSIQVYYYKFYISMFLPMFYFGKFMYNVLKLKIKKKGFK